MSFFFNLLSSSGSAFTPSAEYQAVLTYATAQGWTLPPVDEQRVADTYVRGLVSSGLWAKRDVIWLFATNGDRNFARINYKNPGTFTVAEVSSPTFTAGFGFSSSGSGYLNTGFKLVTNGVNYTTTDAHYAIGICTQTWVPVANGNYVEFGVGGAGSVNGVRFAAGIANGNTNTQINSSNTKSRTYNSKDFGYAIVERRSGASSYNRYRNYVPDTIAETFTAPNNGDVYVCALNVNGTDSFHSPRHVGTLSLGGGLTNALDLIDAELWRNYSEYVNGTSRVTVNATYSVYESSLEIIATRANYQFASDGYNIRFSNDYGATWTIRTWGEMLVGAQMDYRYLVTGAHIFASGTLFFSVASKMYRSTDGLATAPSEVSPKNADGSPYTLHTPVNSIRPGVNFGWYDIDPLPKFLDGGAEILTFGTYGNLNMGASPMGVWYTIDEGVTVKLAYQFGQNTNYRDDGTEDGGTTGTLLGNASETNVCRHTHGIFNNPGTNDYYLLTGDAAPTPSEIAWYKMVYTEVGDTWSAPSLLFTKPVTVTEWKSVTPVFMGTEVIFATDGGAVQGVYRGPIASLGTLGSFTRILAATGLLAGNSVDTDTGFMLTLQFSDKITVSENFGASSVDHTVIGASETTARMVSIGNKDSRGYHKVNIGGMAIMRPLKTVFIKEN